MDKKDINKSYIQKRLLSGWKSTHQYVMENLYVFDWESDFLLKTKSGYWYEAEIKISLSDFKADFKKEGETPDTRKRFQNLEILEIQSSDKREDRIQQRNQNEKT